MPFDVTGIRATPVGLVAVGFVAVGLVVATSACVSRSEMDATPTVPLSGPPMPEGPRAAASAGTTVGSQRYPVPDDAVVASPAGDDTAPGTVAQPVRTVARALALTPTGGTVVLRAGSYPETLVITEPVTVQNWPGEEVWMEGSVVIPAWVPDGDRWRSDGWSVEFDASPTYRRGGPDGSEDGWSFVDAAHPMAAHPDQLWIDGVAQQQVASLDEVAAGAFFHDTAADRLYIGSDPAGREVRASALVKALSVRADGVVLRGFGVRRYAPSVPDMGAVTLERRRISVEHVGIVDSATTGLSVVAAESTIRHVSILRSGMLGLHGNHADDLVIEGLWSEGNNVERFNMAPVSGGLKITRSREVTVRDSTAVDNHGPGMWLDESVYDMTLVGNDLRANARHGASLEISAKALFANNLVVGNGGFGVKVNDTSDVALWNNTFVGNDRSINIVQDRRRYGDGSPGADPRHPDDPVMTWLNGPIVVVNNVIAHQARGDCLLCVEDYSGERTAEEIGVTADGNVYHRVDAHAPTAVVVWSAGGDAPEVFTTIDDFRRATGQEATGLLVTGPSLAEVPASNALPLPIEVAERIGRPPDTRHVGAF